MKYRLTVTLDIPDNLDRASVAEYVADAVATMMGCYHPSSPILQTKGVRVTDTVSRTVVNREVGYTFYDPDYDG